MRIQIAGAQYWRRGIDREANTNQVIKWGGGGGGGDNNLLWLHLFRSFCTLLIL